MIHDLEALAARAKHSPAPPPREIWTPYTMDIRRHQLRRQVALEQESARYERLSLTLTDRDARLEALRLSVEFAARANRLRNIVAAANFMIPESADEEARRIEKEQEE